MISWLDYLKQGTVNDVYLRRAASELLLLLHGLLWVDGSVGLDEHVE
jgi:hypothetical protein